jgi:DNA-binding response OmpR family regulator
VKILIAEDDPNILRGLGELLSNEGYETLLAEDGLLALERFREERPDFVLLDIMMPGLDGYSLCREIRRLDEQVPVIFLSAKSEEIDRVLGLELGADDYITKPFGTREVVARIRAIARRLLKSGENRDIRTFPFGDLQVFPTELRARRGESSIDLSLREIRILELFSRHPGEVVTRDQLFDHAWGYEHMPNSRTLDQHISKLRKRIEADPANPRLITTVYGAGYRFDGQQ